MDKETKVIISLDQYEKYENCMKFFEELNKTGSPFALVIKRPQSFLGNGISYNIEILNHTECERNLKEIIEKQKREIEQLLRSSIAKNTKIIELSNKINLIKSNWISKILFKNL